MPSRAPPGRTSPTGRWSSGTWPYLGRCWRPGRSEGRPSPAGATCRSRAAHRPHKKSVRYPFPWRTSWRPRSRWSTRAPLRPHPGGSCRTGRPPRRRRRRRTGVEDRTNSQPKLLIVPPRAHLEALPRPCGEMKPHTTKAMVAAAATPKTTLSIPSPTSWGWRETDLLRRSSRWRWRRFTVAGEVWKAGVAAATPWRTSPVCSVCGPASRSSCCVNVGGFKSSSLIKLPHRQYSHRLLVDITRVSR